MLEDVLSEDSFLSPYGLRSLSQRHRDEPFTIQVADANDIAPVITTSSNQSVAENSTFVAALASTDADTVGTNPAAFTITGGADAALFDIVGGNLVFKNGRDYETQAHSYQVQVTANDGTNSTAKLITVNLSDMNGNAPGNHHGGDEKRG